MVLQLCRRLCRPPRHGVHASSRDSGRAWRRGTEQAARGGADLLAKARRPGTGLGKRRVFPEN